MGNNLHVTICRFQESCGNIMFQCRHLMDEDDQQWVRDLPLIMGYLLLISVNINKSTGCLSVVIRFLSGHEYFIIISIIIHYMQPAHLPTVRSPSTYNNGFVGFWINGIGNLPPTFWDKVCKLRTKCISWVFSAQNEQTLYFGLREKSTTFRNQHPA